MILGAHEVFDAQTVGSRRFGDLALAAVMSSVRCHYGLPDERPSITTWQPSDVHRSSIFAPTTTLGFYSVHFGLPDNLSHVVAPELGSLRTAAIGGSVIVIA